MAMTENEMAIRRLLNEPGLPTKRMTESQVSNEMLRDMEPDGQLDRARAEEMRRKLADQMFMDMRLRGASEFGGGRVANTGKPEDTSYAKADKAAALALRGQRASTQAEVDRRKRAPAAPDYTDERLRSAMELGLGDINKPDDPIQDRADELFLRYRMPYESAERIARESESRMRLDKAMSTDREVGGRTVKKRGAYLPLANPGQYQEPPDAPNAMKPDVSKYRGEGVYTPKEYDTSPRPPAEIEDAARDAAKRALAKRYAKQRGNQ